MATATAIFLIVPGSWTVVVTDLEIDLVVGDGVVLTRARAQLLEAVGALTAGNIGRSGDAGVVVVLVFLAGRLGRALRTDHLTVGIEALFLGGHAVQVQLGGDVHARLARAQHALDHVLDGLGDAGLDLGLAVLGHLAGQALVAGRRQGLAVLVDDRDLLGLHVRHRRRDQVLDGADHVRRGLARADADGHGGRGLLGVLLEQLTLGQHQVHADAVDALHGLDRALQLALQGALAVQLLDEVGLAERIVGVEDFVADGAGAHEPFAGHHQAGAGDLVARHHDGRAVALGFILDAGLIQRLGDFRGFLQVQVRIEQLTGLLAHEHDQGHEHGDDTRADTQHRGETPDAELPD